MPDSNARAHQQMDAAAPAQPAAAPAEQPVYAHARNAIMDAAYDFRDAHISGCADKKRFAQAALECAVGQVMSTLTASRGQAPAGAPSDEQAMERTSELASSGGRWPSDWVGAYRRGFSDATAQPDAGAVYAELPMQFACSGVFPVYSADQMRAFADGTHALRTKSEASREFLERMLSAMEGVIDVADRKTAEFDALRSCVVDLTLMLFKPEALRASHGQAPAGVLEDAARWKFAEANLTYAEFRDGSYFNTYQWPKDESQQAARAAIDAARKQGANHD